MDIEEDLFIAFFGIVLISTLFDVLQSIREPQHRVNPYLMERRLHGRFYTDVNINSLVYSFYIITSKLLIRLCVLVQ